MVVMAVRDMRMMGSLLMISPLMMTRSLAMVMGSSLIMFGGLGMVFVFRHDGFLSRWEVSVFFRFRKLNPRGNGRKDYR
jgi:hypothetical protein